MNVVVDAGVLVKLFVNEAHTKQAELLLEDRFRLEGPELLLAEFGNVLWKKCRFEDLDESTAKAAIASLPSYEIRIHSNEDLLEPAFVGALQTGQSAYDWIYLTLAISLKCKLVTADRKFFLGMRNTRYKEYLIWIENLPCS